MLPDSRFSCQHCGLCCQVFPRIPVDSERAETILRNLPAIGELLSDTLPPTPLSTINEENSSCATLARRASGECVFLTRDKKCAIHMMLGESAKPQVCRDFPYIFRRTPAGIFVGLSYSCPSVRAGMGTLLSEQLPQLRRHAHEAYRCDTIRDAIGFDGAYAIRWAAYEMIEGALFDLLAQTAFALPHRLSAAHVLFGMFRLWAEARVPRVPGSIEQLLIADEEVRAFIGVLRRSEFREPLRIASKPRPNAAARRTFLGLLLACAASMWKSGKPLQASWILVANYVASALGIGRMQVPPLPSALPRNILNAKIDGLPPEADEMLERYVNMCIFRKDLALEKQGLRRGLELLTLRVALVPVYAHASIITHGTEPLQAFSEALGTVENYFGHHSQLFAVVDQIPRLASVFDSFFSQKNFADMIMGRDK
ncbi:MAG: YkgJ family cysteine cluster protein [Candidatus Sumerlaeaceae bacterium]